jgi:hypothetical protein
VLGPRISIDGDAVGSFAAGPYLRPVVTEHAGEQEGIQVDLEPLAARRLLGVPMAELAGRCVCLDELVGKELTEWVGETPGIGIPGTDELFERAKAAGAEVVREPFDTDYGSHDFTVRDPEGNIWNVGTYDPATSAAA